MKMEYQVKRLAQNIFSLIVPSKSWFLPGTKYPTALGRASPTGLVSVPQDSYWGATRLVLAPFLAGFRRGAHQSPAVGHTAKVPDAKFAWNCAFKYCEGGRSKNAAGLVEKNMFARVALFLFFSIALFIEISLCVNSPAKLCRQYRQRLRWRKSTRKVWKGLNWMKKPLLFIVVFSFFCILFFVLVDEDEDKSPV